jgi:hypothetical protein
MRETQPPQYLTQKPDKNYSLFRFFSFLPFSKGKGCQSDQKSLRDIEQEFGLGQKSNNNILSMVQKWKVRKKIYEKNKYFLFIARLILVIIIF